MTDAPAPCTVSQLTQQIKTRIETAFRRVAVVGEVSSCVRAGSGHLYFTLKDEAAQIKAVMWRSAAARVKFDVHDGLEVVAQGGVELYAPRGHYQLIVEKLVPQGIGPLELAFRQMYERLGREGLFAPERKRPIPRFPRRIALITSPQGAAVRDLLQVIMRRWPFCEILLLPVSVQGPTAAPEIAAAFARLPRLGAIDVVITGRGGGSLEDLWAFNEEAVARAIAACAIPVISAVGHEIDVTICDLVADRRALTPSEAGELAVPLQTEVVEQLAQLRARLERALRHRAQATRAQLDALAARPVLAQPTVRLQDLRRRLDDQRARLQRSLLLTCAQKRAQLAALAGSLDALSPLKVLGRGYSLTTLAATGRLLQSAADVQPGDEIETRLAAGRVRSRVQARDLDSVD